MEVILLSVNHLNKVAILQHCGRKRLLICNGCNELFELNSSAPVLPFLSTVVFPLTLDGKYFQRGKHEIKRIEYRTAEQRTAE
jgi:hypothetical protein